jgi:hypothetical protein
VNEILFSLGLALAWFGAVNLGMSSLVAGVARLSERRVLHIRASSASAVLLTLKLLPGVASLGFTLAVFLPAHWMFEPAGVRESLGYTLAGVGLLGAWVIVLAVRRTVRDSRATMVLERAWEQKAGGPRTILDGGLPVYGFADPSPIISLAGVRHPRVYVADGVLAAFSNEELDVSLAHEAAHRDASDNLKRILMASSPDFLGLWGPGRRLERRWRAAAEFAADARAVRDSEERAVSLASALLKVARLAPVVGAWSPGSAFYDGVLLRARIDRLLGPLQRSPRPRRARRGWPVSIGAVTALAAAVVAAETLWFAVHVATEGLVRILP